MRYNGSKECTVLTSFMTNSFVSRQCIKEAVNVIGPPIGLVNAAGIGSIRIRLISNSNQ